MPDVTLLMLNAGRRIELLRLFRKTFKDLGVAGKIIATDIQPYAPTMVEADERHLLPQSSEPNFVEELTDLCRRRKVSLVIPLIDPDLPVLSRNRAAIEASGAKVLISGAEQIKTCLNKFNATIFLRKNGFSTPRLHELETARKTEFPLFMKSAYGSGSKHAVKLDSLADLDYWIDKIPNPLIQEFIDGEEYTVDAYCDGASRPLAVSPRLRIKVRAGEVITSRLENIPELSGLIKDLVQKLGVQGPVNIQTIRNNGTHYVTDINTRFGGGCVLSIAGGARFVEWTIETALGRKPSCKQGPIKTGIVMLRHDDSVFVDNDELLNSCASQP